jgi:hypothetical protein
MAKINLKKIIGNNAHWTINKTIARQIGLTETLVLQHIIDLESVFKRNEIFQAIPEMAEELCLTEYSVKQAIGKLKSLDLVSIERKSMGYRNFYSINEEKVIEFISGSGQLTSEVNSTHQRVEGVSELNSVSQSVENESTSELNSTYSELKTSSQRVENDTAITNNTTNNTLQTILTNNTTAADSISNRTINLVSKALDLLIERELEDEQYSGATYIINEAGGLDEALKIVGRYGGIRENWANAIMQNSMIYGFKIKQ